MCTKVEELKAEVQRREKELAEVKKRLQEEEEKAKNPKHGDYGVTDMGSKRLFVYQNGKIVAYADDGVIACSDVELQVRTFPSQYKIRGNVFK